MASEVIKLNLIPKGEMPVFHASQFDNGRLITCELYRGEDAYTVPEGYTVELHCRKRDNNIVTLASTLINDNVVTFTSTTQLTACHGKNLCEVAIKAADDYLIGTLNFYLEVEKDPLEGGINSTSEIHNLYDQVEEITTEVIGDNYYDKTETDALLDEKADAADVYTKTETDTKLALKADASSVYTKSQTDTLLSAKASITYVDGEISAVDAVLIDMQTDIDRKADAADVYTKSQTDSALALKANAADVYTKSQTYTQAEVDALIDNIFPTLTATGAIASFITALQKPLVSVTAAAGATTVTRCGKNLLAPVITVPWWCSGTGTVSPDYQGGRTEYIRINGRTVYLKVYAPTYLYSCSIVELDANMDFIKRNHYASDFNIENSVTLDTDTRYIYIQFYSSDGNASIELFNNAQIQLTLNSDMGDYESYNGQTVPVADATTLVTQSGVNNVYADAGDITVQYKYMSM